MIKSERTRLAGHVACMGRLEIYTKFWSEKCEGKRQLGRPRCKLEDNIRIAL
jgi:hypothetical protein